MDFKRYLPVLQWTVVSRYVGRKLTNTIIKHFGSLKNWKLKKGVLLVIRYIRMDESERTESTNQFGLKQVKRFIQLNGTEEISTWRK